MPGLPYSRGTSTLHSLHAYSTCIRLYYLDMEHLLNSDDSVILQELSLNVHTFHLKNIPLLFVMSIESSSGSVKGSGGKQIMP